MQGAGLAEDARTDPGPAYRCGVVALLGLPNAGKSTLFNRLLGQKLAIVTPKPQTTRSRLLGIRTLERAQLLLLDTPGLHEGKGELHASMQRAAIAAAEDCDLGLLLIDSTKGWEPAHGVAAARLSRLRKPWLVVGTKGDLPRPERAIWPPREVRDGPPALLLSGQSGAGVRALLKTISALLPPGPPLRAPEELTDRPLRFLAGELVREAVFQQLREELPYAIAVEVDEYDETTRSDLVRIRANLLVRRSSQKSIVIGAGGERIRSIGTQARQEIERLVERKVHLELWVKVDAGWAQQRRRLEALGYV
ncbi:MAG TPA: GTPase Era [Myxococcota bacterium]|nr:GTPase Era [Myxococcota bacterium]